VITRDQGHKEEGGEGEWCNHPRWQSLRGEKLTYQSKKKTDFLHSKNLNYSANKRKFIIIIFLHGLGHLTCSSIDALPSFPGASTISSSSRFVVEGVFRKTGVIHAFKMVDPVLFVFGFHVLYSRDL